MKQRLAALRYFVGALALNLAFGLVAFAQQTAGGQQPAAQPVKEYPKTRIEGMVHEWTRARDYTKEYLDAMPEAGIGFKPTPEIRSFAEQMLHLAAANFSFGARLTGQTNPYAGKNLEKLDEFKTKPALTKIVVESYDFMINGINKLDDAKLDTRMPVVGMNRPLTALFAAAFEHQTHHRGQTTIYLRLKGVTPPGEKLY
jgi:uncharacterized damage-inducible protein DinB